MLRARIDTGASISAIPMSVVRQFQRVGDPLGRVGGRQEPVTLDDGRSAVSWVYRADPELVDAAGHSWMVAHEERRPAYRGVCAFERHTLLIGMNVLSLCDSFVVEGRRGRAFIVVA